MSNEAAINYTKLAVYNLSEENIELTPEEIGREMEYLFDILTSNEVKAQTKKLNI